MRIISGIYKGLKINLPQGLTARPTTDRAKEGLFQWLLVQEMIEEQDILDLFCGSGSVSLEFLSNGARFLRSVDWSNQSLRFLQQIQREKQLSQHWELQKADVFKYLDQVPDQTFDLVFADPPYGLSSIPKLPQLVLDKGWVKPGGLFILEHQHLLQTPATKRIAQKQYGISTFSIYQA